MRMPQISALISLAFFLLSGQFAFAAEGRQLIDDSLLPQTSASLTDFVVSGWGIESTIQGDINADGQDDAVLVLLEAAKESHKENVDDSRSRALVVLLKSTNGQYRRLSVAKRLLRCKTCYGMLSGPEGGAPEVQIAKGVIIVEEMWGARETIGTRLTFRHDQKANKILLIGEDIEKNDRATGFLKRVSSNFLTQTKITETERYSDKLDKFQKIGRKKQRIPRSKRTIEEIDFESYS